MVNDDIDHQVHIPLMQSVRESSQVVTGAEMRVEGIEVLWPVSKSRTIDDSSGVCSFCIEGWKTNP